VAPPCKECGEADPVVAMAVAAPTTWQYGGILYDGPSMAATFTRIHNNTFSLTHTHTHNRFTALLEYDREHPGEQGPER